MKRKRDPPAPMVQGRANTTEVNAGKNAFTAYKGQPSEIHLKIHQKLHEKCHRTKDGKIKLREANFCLSHYVRLTKEEMFYFYKEMEAVGLIRVIPYNFIVLLNGAET